jgi:pyruvate dehydrogenase (quinone)
MRDDTTSRATGVKRRAFMQMTAAGAALAGSVAGVAGTAKAQSVAATAAPSETQADITRQPAPDFADDLNTSDIIVETLIAWGATHVFGVVGDGINPLIEALRRRKDRIAYIGTRHEEAAAFMAAGIAKHTGRLGVCIGTTGPGAIHLLNGLYDAHFDGAPVVALTGTTFHDLIGVRYQQSVDTTKLMQDVALYNIEVTGPEHAVIVANRACRVALGDRGVAHLTIAKDVQLMKRSADKRSMRNPGVRSSSSWTPPLSAPPADQLDAAAALLNAGARVAVLAGQGALQAREEVAALADILGAPVAKALLGRAVLPDDSPFTTGGIGDLGTAPSSWAMKNCDSVFILGSTMPWEEYYPTPGQARGVQVDIKPDRIGLRYPIEVGLTGDVKATLQGLLPRLQRKTDRAFLTEAQHRMAEWNALLERIETTERTPLRPQMVIRALSDLLADDAVISLDCGANTHFAARCLRLRERQRLTGTGMLASMAPGVSYAIAGQLAFPGRQSVAVVGDGGFAMLMAELTTAVAHSLPIKIILLKNDSLAEVKFEQQEIGNPEYGCNLAPIDFVAFARACGAEGYRCAQPSEVRPAIAAALRSPKPALVEAVVDANEKPMKPEALRV